MENIDEETTESLIGIVGKRISYSSIQSTRSPRTTASINSSSAVQSDASGDNYNVNQGFVVIQAPDTNVSRAVKRCKTVVNWYYAAIKSLGWAPLSQNEGRRCLHRFCRGLIISIWFILLFGTFFFEILSCFSRSKLIFGTLKNGTDNRTRREISCHAHLLSKFILDDVLIIIVYLYGIYLFSFGETEYMYKITAKMFTKGNVEKQNLIIATIVAFFAFGLFWIFLSFVIRLMIAASTHLFDSKTHIVWNKHYEFSDDGKDVIVIAAIFLFITNDIIYYMCTINYVVQSQMIISYARSVGEMIRNKTHSSLEGVENVTSAILIKDFGDIREKIHMLNGKAATATSIVIFIMAINTIFTLISLDHINEKSRNIDLPTATAILNLFLWSCHVLLPLIQAARVSHQGKKLKEVGFYLFTAPFEYRNTDQKELDSFLAGAQAAKLRATLFGIPIYPWVFYAVVVVFAIVTLMVIQEGVYRLPDTF